MIMETKEHSPLLSSQCVSSVSGIPVQQKLSYLLHKAIICLKAVLVIGIFESVETVAFYHCCSSLGERCLPSQHHILTVPVVQCDQWPVFSSALCESELGDIESSTEQQGTDISAIYSH